MTAPAFRTQILLGAIGAVIELTLACDKSKELQPEPPSIQSVAAIERPPLPRSEDTCIDTKERLLGRPLSDSLQQRNLFIRGDDSLYLYSINGGCQETWFKRGWKYPQ